jgi:hypothetical protein
MIESLIYYQHKSTGGPTQAALDRGYAPWVSGAIFPNWFGAKSRRGQNRPGK